MTGPVKIDMVKVQQRKREMVDGLMTFHLGRYKASGSRTRSWEGSLRRA